MNHTGSCHCGKVSFEVEGDIGKLAECNCSHCSRKGFLLWFLPRSALTLLSGEADLVSYTFNRHVIEHRFCRHCGVQPFGFGKDEHGNDTVAVNARCIEGIEPGDYERIHFDGRSY